MTSEPWHVTVESIASGRDLELARFVNGWRAYLIVKCADGRIALVSAAVDDDGHVLKHQAVTRFAPERLADLERAITAARATLGV